MSSSLAQEEDLSAGGFCALEVKTLQGNKILLEHVSLTETVEDIYERVARLLLETNHDQRTWKLMIVIPGRGGLTLKEKARTLASYHTQDGHQYRIEVILDMGACHTRRPLS
eukprot:scaffold7597_cov66-Attheya_sp.AAC.2